MLNKLLCHKFSASTQRPVVATTASLPSALLLMIYSFIDENVQGESGSLIQAIFGRTCALSVFQIELPSVLSFTRHVFSLSFPSLLQLIQAMYLEDSTKLGLMYKNSRQKKLVASRYFFYKESGGGGSQKHEGRI